MVSVRGTMSGGAMKVAKGLLDYGVHSPTVYFPLTVEEALMIEPTETETLEALDEYAELLNGLHERLSGESWRTNRRTPASGRSMRSRHRTLYPSRLSGDRRDGDDRRPGEEREGEPCTSLSRRRRAGSSAS